MKSHPTNQNNTKNIARSVGIGIVILLYTFLVSTILVGIVGLIFVSLTAPGCWESCPLMVIILSPWIGGLISIVAGIRGGMKEYKSSIRYPISKIELLELQSIANERRSDPSNIQADEIPKWKEGFKKIGWLEEIGKNTQAVLMNSPEIPDVSQEPLLCITYADVRGSHISDVWFNQVDMSSQFTSMIATSKRLILVHPKKKIVQVIEYKIIHDINTTASSKSKVYTISTISGDVVKININFSNTDDETIVDLFFERITYAKTAG